MGATVGAAARGRAEVWWSSEDRSKATRKRAEDAGLKEAPTLAALLESCEVVISVCPPDAAEEQARSVVESGFRGLYVDANAISVESALTLSALVEQAGATFVDGGLVGPPARREGTTRFFLSGDGAERVAALFAESMLQAVCLEGGAGTASALKMAYASYTKGHAALMIAVRALARQLKVEDALLEEWERSQPGLRQRSDSAASRTAPKAWRFEGEMREIAATFEAAGLPGEFHEAAAQIYGRLRELKDATDVDADVAIDSVLDRSRESER